MDTTCPRRSRAAPPSEEQPAHRRRLNETLVDGSRDLGADAPPARSDWLDRWYLIPESTSYDRMDYFTIHTLIGAEKKAAPMPGIAAADIEGSSTANRPADTAQPVQQPVPAPATANRPDVPPGLNASQGGLTIAEVEALRFEAAALRNEVATLHNQMETLRNEMEQLRGDVGALHRTAFTYQPDQRSGGAASMDGTHSSASDPSWTWTDSHA